MHGAKLPVVGLGVAPVSLVGFTGVILGRTGVLHVAHGWAGACAARPRTFATIRPIATTIRKTRILRAELATVLRRPRTGWPTLIKADG